MFLQVIALSGLLALARTGASTAPAAVPTESAVQEAGRAGPSTTPETDVPADPFASGQDHKPTTSEGWPLDLEGRRTNPFSDTKVKTIVLLFVRTDCPISNRYAPEVRRLQKTFASQGVVFWMVYPDPDETVPAIKKHLEEYRLGVRALRDTKHSLVEATGVRVTPEAAVFSRDGTTLSLVYCGRIDDRWADLGKMRPEPTTHDLESGIRAALAGVHTLRRTTAIGCNIPELR